MGASGRQAVQTGHQGEAMETLGALLRFIAAQPRPVSWYTIRYRDVGEFATPVAALHALAAQGWIAPTPSADGVRYQVTEQGKQWLLTHPVEGGNAGDIEVRQGDSR